MKGLRLRERELGSEFCRFERSLIFDEEKTDVGYVRFQDSSSFRLVKSRFTQIENRRLYLIPDDLRDRIWEGRFVRIVPGRLIRKVRVADRKRGPKAGFEYLDVVEVDAVEEPRMPLTPPDLPRDDFLMKVSTGWKQAEDDMLDTVMALLMVSSPGSVYGKGGLGSEGLEVMRMQGTGTVRDVSRCIVSQLPVEFRTSGADQYRYKPVDTLKGIIEMEKGKIPEECFSLLRPHRRSASLKEKGVAIQLPFILKEAEFKLKAKDIQLDRDVLDYQLTALYMPPPSEGMVERFARDAVRSSFTETLWDEVGLGEPDPMAGIRLGLALTRLNVGKQFTPRGFIRKRTDLNEGMELFSTLLKRGMEELRKRSREADFIRAQKTHPWRDKIKDIDRRVYLHLREMYENQGIEEIEVDSLLPDQDRRSIDGSLRRLNRYGYVLMMKGGQTVKVIVSSGPEDLE